MKWIKQFSILREGFGQYITFKKFVKLSPEDRVKSRIPSKLPPTLINLGPAFIKLGQILSTRPDMLPREYVQSLEVLQENVPPFSFEDVKALMREEFGRDVSDLYRSFDEAPVASASLAQVHFAILPSGEEVAVKVQRPDVQKRITDDLDAIDSLLGFAKKMMPQRMKRSNLEAAFDEFKRYTRQELDFAVEARTMERFARNFEGWKDVVVPKVYWTHSSRRIITMQRVSGLRLGQVTEILPMERRERMAKRLTEMEMKMFISDGFFHADLHPGNILFREDGNIVLLDFGMFGELSEEEIDHFTLYWLAVVQRQVKRAFYHFTRMTRRLTHADEDAFFENFKSLAERFYASKLSEMSLTQVYFEMILAGYKFGFVFPSHLMLHAKAITTAEALAFILAPEIKVEQLTKDAVRREFATRASDPRRLAFRLGQIVPELMLTGEVLPASARDAYEKGFDTDFTVMGLADLLSSLAENMKRVDDAAQLPRILIDPFAKSILSEYHDKSGVEKILEEAWSRFREIEPEIPVLSKLGPTINLRLAGATLAMYEVLLSVGHSSEDALEIFKRISWLVYDRMGDIPMMAASAVTSDPYGRMKLATQIFRDFPFSSPDYQMVDIPSEKNVVGFDVLKCPVAEFFKSEGREDLCYATWCELDFPLAEKWGGKLERATTIAQGSDRCRFRWKTGSQGNPLVKLEEVKDAHASLENTTINTSRELR
jgi:ubiquinone biosynthesis protein